MSLVSLSGDQMALDLTQAGAVPSLDARIFRLAAPTPSAATLLERQAHQTAASIRMTDALNRLKKTEKSNY
jgi:hypothetical protein